MRLNMIMALAFAGAAMSGCSSDPLVSSGYIELGLVGPSDGTPTVMNAVVREELKNATAAVVIVDQVELEVQGKGWVPVLTAPVTIDLLKLDNKTITSLGITKLPTGHVDDLRLRLNEIGDYIQFKDGTKKPLEVPADGILHVDGTFDVEPCATGTIILDFDPKLKVEDETGRREYELEPKAKIKTVKQSGSCAPLDGGTKTDAAPADMAPTTCGGKICAPGEACVNMMCVADPCAGKICAPGESCNPTSGMCEPTPPPEADMATPHKDGGSNMDGSCKK